MILSCNSCEKKFVVPDQAITAAGRTVQCGSCGNKWKQYPINNKAKIKENSPIVNNKKTPKSVKPKKERVKKTSRISLYSPEYLAKKHGINLNDLKPVTENTTNTKVTFGFYNSVIILIFVTIVLSRGLYFFEDLIVKELPITEFYLNYFFENIRNIFEIIKSLVTNY